MTRKQIDTMREARLWIGQVLVPIGTLVLGVSQIPGVKEKAAETVRSIKNKFTRKEKTRH